MKISLNTVKEYTDISWSTSELVEKLSSRLGGVEGFEDLSKIYDDSYIVRVVDTQKHPDADKLTVCLIDDGGVARDIDRNESGYVVVVCGASNVSKGMLAVWLPPGARVPSSIVSGDDFRLSSRSLRGVVSHGMLASVSELSLGDDHSGIVDVTGDDVEVGQLFSEVYSLNDIVIEIENKMFTHRPDCFGQIGLAREISGIQHRPFKSPEWYESTPAIEASSELDLQIVNSAGHKVPRFTGLALKDIKVDVSPLWLRVYLSKFGVQSINNIVDITNYVMLTTAQPLHAYDYDKVSGATLVSRFAEPGESVDLLNGREYRLHKEDIVIADKKSILGIAGVMGGLGSEVSQTTTQIILESANFDMYALRKTSMRHGLFTDALTRFNKGQSPLQTDRALALAVDLLVRYAGAKVASPVQDIQTGLEIKSAPIRVSAQFINDRLGLSLGVNEMAELLNNVEIPTQIDGDDLVVVSPFWRTDIDIKEDIVEEVGRLYGFDRLERVLPLAPTSPVRENTQRRLRQDLRNIISGMGGNEVLTYSFVNEKVLRSASQPIERAFKISNALSPDLQYYRLNVLPSLLDKVHANIKAGYGSLMIYEFGKGHDTQADLIDGVPSEQQYLEMIYTSTKSQDGAAFYFSRRVVDEITAKLGVKVVIKPVIESDDSIVLGPMHSRRRAQVLTLDRIHLGYIGEISTAARKNFKLPEYTAAVSIDLNALEVVIGSVGSRYEPLSRFPKVYRDVSLRTSIEVTAYDIESSAELGVEIASKEGVSVNYEIVDVFKPDDVNTKNTTLHFSLVSYTKTLDGDQVAAIMDKITSRMCLDLKAEII